MTRSGHVLYQTDVHGGGGEDLTVDNTVTMYSRNQFDQFNKHGYCDMWRSDLALLLFEPLTGLFSIAMAATLKLMGIDRQ